MKSKNLFFIILLVLAFQLPVVRAFAQAEPVIAYAEIEVRGAKIKGTSTATTNKDQIELTGFSYNTKSPRDAANGAATGKITTTFSFIKKADIASVPLAMAAQRNEVLNLVVIHLLHRDGTGRLAEFETITLTNAAISQFTQTLGAYSAVPTAIGLNDEIELTAQRIDITAK